MLVAVGSSNPSKVNAVRAVWKILGDAEVKGVEVETGIPPQPIGLSQTLRGAANRALRAMDALNADYGVGIEAGLIPVPSTSGYLDLQAAVVVGPGRRASIGFSQAFELPAEWVQHIILGGHELEDVAVEKTGIPRIGEKIGVIGWLTSGLVTRLDLSSQAVMMALIPWSRNKIYGSLIHIEKLLEKLGNEASR